MPGETDRHDYRKLQQHLNRMPVGFPRTISGVERRILKRLFSPREAQVALLLSHRLETVGAICKRASGPVFSRREIRATLQRMARKGTVLNVRRNQGEHYALVPFVVGMFEFQGPLLSARLYKDTVRYFKQSFALEYLSTALPQTRVIPIRKSIDASHTVATYDEIRALVERAEGRVGLAPCICRKGKDLLGDACKRTERREVCLVLRDLFDHGYRQGLAKPIETAEALEILVRNEEEGLVLQPSNEQEPQFVCSCCPCCCGLLGILKALPSPVDFVASNYAAVVQTADCNGCGLCSRRCPMDAVSLVAQRSRLDPKRCIGCGICVAACAQGAIRLVSISDPVQPPATTDDLYAIINDRKAGLWGKVKTTIRIVWPSD